MNAKKTIVILGAGFGGLRVALVLARKLRQLTLTDRYEVVLIERNDHHTYTPLLYEVATTSKETANLRELHEVVAYRVADIVQRFPVRFVQSEVAECDVLHGAIHLKNGETIRAHYLVIALGSETNYFNISGLKEAALPLKTLYDAVRIRDSFLELTASELSEIKVVIGGGGPTGVELAGEIQLWCGHLEHEHPHCRLKVTLIEVKPTILFGFHPRIITLAQARLKKLGVETVTNKKITAAAKNRIKFEDGSYLPYDLLVWTGGVKAQSVLSRTPLKSDPASRIEVIGEMECLPQTSDLKLGARIYGLGDAICFYDPITKKAIPGVARAAISQGNVVAHNIIEEIKASQNPRYQPRVKSYQPIEYPYITPVGGKFAIAKIGPIIISGFFGWILKGLVELNYLVSIMPISKALRIWLKGLRIFIQNERLG